jgi:hypothetical protein
VTATCIVVPEDDRHDFSDFKELILPCEQLHLHHGEHQVKYIVQITRQVNQEQAEVLAESALSSCVVTLYPLASAEITRH